MTKITIELDLPFIEATVLIEKAAVDVIKERLRQLCAEGWTPAHDDQHTGGQLAQAAICYAAGPDANGEPRTHWPYLWNRSWWKPGEVRRNLVKAAALLIAEIARIDRVERFR